jgi:hypothetical protein
MSTDPTRNTGPGTLAPKLSDIPSTGCICMTSWLVWLWTGALRKISKGVRLNWIVISVWRCASRFQVRT